MNERQFEILFVTVILVVHLALGIQCLNFCDEVFVIASGQQIFSHPESISYIFMYYWGAFFAGVWNIFFADWGVYGFRVVNALLITLTYFIAYRTVRPYVNRWYVLAGVFMAMLAETSDITMVIHHNSVTCFFTTCAAYFLFKGLTKGKRLNFFIGGVVLGINVFSRLTNIALIGLLLSLVPYYYYNRNTKTTFQLAVSFVTGFLVGIAVVILLMMALGHLYLFVDVLMMMGSISQDPLSGHGFALLIPRYLKDYSIIAGVILYISLALKWSRRHPFYLNDRKYLQFLLCFVLTVPMLAIPFIRVLNSIFVNLHFYYALMTLCIGYVLYYYRNEKKLVYLGTLAILIIYIQPLGGDFGIENMHSCSIRFAMPLSFGLFGLILKRDIDDSFTQKFLFSFVGVLFLWGGYIATFHRAWYDATSRFEYTTIPKTRLANVLLKENYANLVDDVMAKLGEYTDKYNSLFVIGYMPLFNYLSGMQPYLQCCTPDFYSPMILKQQIESAELRHGKELPIVIRGMAKGSIIEKYDPEWRNLELKDPRNQAKFNIYEGFLKRHNYKEVWREESFAILLPSK